MASNKKIEDALTALDEKLTTLSDTVDAVVATDATEDAAFQAEITARNDWSRYGTTFDGTTWTAGGVA